MERELDPIQQDAIRKVFESMAHGLGIVASLHPYLEKEDVDRHKLVIQKGVRELQDVPGLGNIWAYQVGEKTYLLSTGEVVQQEEVFPDNYTSANIMDWATLAAILELEPT